MIGARPESIGRFEIRREVGRGAMGVVYEAFDPTLHRRVALKTIALGGEAPEEERRAFEERFLAEARAVARLSHPGVVTVHDAGRDDASGALYIALEYLEGRTLADLAEREAPLPWRDALRLVGSVARALHAAHQAGIVHRDVKPANIMLLPGGETKVMDFGIAKLQAGLAQLTSTGQLLGTPLYMSPEQALDRPLDGRSDLFSLGTVAYQLLTGVKAFHADSVPRIVTKVAYEDARPATQLRPDLPPHVDRLLATLLAKDPSDRYPDGLKVAEDVDALLEGRPPQHARTAPGAGERTAIAPATRGAEPATSAGATRTVVAHRRPTARTWALAAGAVLLFAAGLLTARAVWLRGGSGTDGSTSGSGAISGATTAPTPEPARLRVDFRHHYKNGALRVWVDKQLVIERSLAGDVRAEVAGIKFRRGVVEATVDVTPGWHDVWVEVSWDDNRRAEGIGATFAAGRARTLEVRIDRLIKNMSLEWQ